MPDKKKLIKRKPILKARLNVQLTNIPTYTITLRNRKYYTTKSRIQLYRKVQSIKNQNKKKYKVKIHDQVQQWDIKKPKKKYIKK